MYNSDSQSKIVETIKTDWNHLVSNDAAFIRSNASWLRRSSSCPICKSLSHTYLCSKHSFNYNRCCSCGHVFFDFFPTDEAHNWYWLSSPALKMWNNTYSLQINKRNLLAKQRVDSIIDAIKPNSFPGKHLNILEIGAGKGDLSL